jgi:hypothetical protein
MSEEGGGASDLAVRICSTVWISVSDAIAVVRRRFWLPEDFATSQETNDVLEIPRTLFERLTDTLCYAA